MTRAPWTYLIYHLAPLQTSCQRCPNTLVQIILERENLINITRLENLYTQHLHFCLWLNHATAVSPRHKLCMKNVIGKKANTVELWSLEWRSVSKVKSVIISRQEGRSRGPLLFARPASVSAIYKKFASLCYVSVRSACDETRRGGVKNMSPVTILRLCYLWSAILTSPIFTRLFQYIRRKILLWNRDSKEIFLFTKK